MEKYRRIGLKLTPQRLAILQYLEGNTDHPSAEMIYSVVKKKYPMMSFATVYKTIEALKKSGFEIDSEKSDPKGGRGNFNITIVPKSE